MNFSEMPRFTTLTTLDDSTKVDVQPASSAATPLVVDTVNLVRSSNAGADSSQFSLYLNSRRREQERLDAIAVKALVDDQAQTLKLKVEQMKKEDEARTKKLAEKRKKRKQKKLNKTSASNADEESHKSSDEEGEEINVLKHKNDK